MVVKCVIGVARLCDGRWSQRGKKVMVRLSESISRRKVPKFKLFNYNINQSFENISTLRLFEYCSFRSNMIDLYGIRIYLKNHRKSKVSLKSLMLLFRSSFKKIFLVCIFWLSSSDHQSVSIFMKKITCMKINNKCACERKNCPEKTEKFQRK